MTGTPPFLLETPRAREPEATDLLSELLATVHLSGSVLFCAEFRAPWAVTVPDSCQLGALLPFGDGRIVPFHVIAQGGCILEGSDGVRIVLGAGDAVLMPYGDGHVLRQGHAAPIAAAALMPPPPWRAPPTLRHGGSGEVTEIVCGFVHCEEMLFEPFLRSLPSVLHVHPSASPADEWLRTTIRYTAHEASHVNPGARCMLARLTELMFVGVLRNHIQSHSPGQIGWLAALNDPLVGPALRCLHAAPQDAWTVERLARHVGVSRTVLADRFTQLIDQPPMRYLTRWRLQLAAQLLRTSAALIKDVAERAGYETEPAFSRAFKRLFGAPPADWRRRQVAGAAAALRAAAIKSPPLTSS